MAQELLRLQEAVGRSVSDVYIAPVGTEPAFGAGEWFHAGYITEPITYEPDPAWEEVRATLTEFSGTLTFDLQYVNRALIRLLVGPWVDTKAMRTEYRRRTKHRKRRRR